MITRQIFWTVVLAVCSCMLSALPALADYPPYATAPPPSDPYSVAEAPGAIQSLPVQSVAQAYPSPPAWQPPSAAVAPASIAQSPAQYTSPMVVPAPVMVASAPVAVVPEEEIFEPVSQRTIGSSVYTRVDYFRWIEMEEQRIILHEDGALATLGYTHQTGFQRVRAEVFGSEVNYSEPGSTFHDPTDFLSTKTNYLGVRAEYELIYQPIHWPRIDFFGGLGTRYWVRDRLDGVTDNGQPFGGFNETWWTVYPYFGMDSYRPLGKNVDLYAQTRIGFTLATHETLGSIALWPQPGIELQLEEGFRGKNWLLAMYLEEMDFGQSGAFHGDREPESAMFTIGLKAGYLF